MADQGQERPYVCTGPSITVLSSSFRQLRAAPGGRVLGWFRAGRAGPVLQEGRGLSPGERSGSKEAWSPARGGRKGKTGTSRRVLRWCHGNKGTRDSNTGISFVSKLREFLDSSS